MSLESAITSRPASTLDRNGKIARIRAIRAEHARAAAFYAGRVERARAAARYSEAAHWVDAYRRSAARCRLLGEMIRREREAA